MIIQKTYVINVGSKRGMMVVINNKQTRYNKIERRNITWHTWINLTKECETCKHKKDERTCTLNGIEREFFTKGLIRNKCSVKIRTSSRKV